MMPTMVRRFPTPTTSEATSWMWIGLAGAYLAILTLGMTRVSYDIWGGLVLGPVLAALTLPVMRRAVRRDDPSLVNLITLAFMLKLVGSVIRYYVTFEVYDTGDAADYHTSGSMLAKAFWDGTFGEAYQELIPDLIGTGFIRLTTGLLYIVTGPTRFGGFIAYSVLSFWGLFFFYRALRVAFPDADYRRYAKLLFLLPSMIYWPSSIGKEAWMIAAIGLATYGVALIMKHNPLGFPYAGFGMAGTAMVRPHVTALCVVSLLFAYVLRRRSWRESPLGPFPRWIGIGVMLGAGAVVMSQVASFFDLQTVDTQSVDTVLEDTERRTGQGGSEFEATRPSSPSQYPRAILAVLFRPFPWEATNVQSAIAAAEGAVLMAVCFRSWRRLIRVPGFLFRVPYLSYCVAYIAMFAFAFSSMGNFGIVSRQRTQLFPLFLVVLCVPPPRIDDGDDLVDDRHRLLLDRVPSRPY
jgi:hypothetical protein